MRISRYADLNDPFELLAINVDYPGIREGIRILRDQTHNRFRLLCFSKSTEDPLLGSHYAEKHRAICLGFDVPGDAARVVEYVNDNPSTGRISERSVRALLATKFEPWKYEEEVRLSVRLGEQ